MANIIEFKRKMVAGDCFPLSFSLHVSHKEDGVIAFYIDGFGDEPTGDEKRRIYRALREAVLFLEYELMDEGM